LERLGSVWEGLGSVLERLGSVLTQKNRKISARVTESATLDGNRVPSLDYVYDTGRRLIEFNTPSPRGRADCLRFAHPAEANQRPEAGKLGSTVPTFYSPIHAHVSRHHGLVCFLKNLNRLEQGFDRHEFDKYMYVFQTIVRISFLDALTISGPREDEWTERQTVGPTGWDRTRVEKAQDGMRRDGPGTKKSKLSLQGVPISEILLSDVTCMLQSHTSIGVAVGFH